MRNKLEINTLLILEQKQKIQYLYGEELRIITIEQWELLDALVGQQHGNSAVIISEQCFTTKEFEQMTSAA